MEANEAPLPTLPYGDVAVVFTDLDGTLFPGPAYESEPKEQRPGLMKNMTAASALEALGVPVIPATGNNICLAQVKLMDPLTGAMLRDLSTAPGIYCNGALVKGIGGREIDVRALGDFVSRFVDLYVARPPAVRADVCVMGLCKERGVVMRLDGMQEAQMRAGIQFKKHMEIPDDRWEWLPPAEFVAQRADILSLCMLLPRAEGSEEKQAAEESLIGLQKWLHECQLLSFAEPQRKSSGRSDIAVCKHVQVPGIGPEIDISPLGVNKGSAMVKLLADPEGNLGVAAAGSDALAVFGDAANDVELFGMARNAAGTELEPLAQGYRPAIRVAMPWANDDLLLKDSNVQATVDRVLEAILSARGPAKEESGGFCSCS